jgi:hypothetical protein
MPEAVNFNFYTLTPRPDIAKLFMQAIRASLDVINQQIHTIRIVPGAISACIWYSR